MTLAVYDVMAKSLARFEKERCRIAADPRDAAQRRRRRHHRAAELARSARNGAGRRPGHAGGNAVHRHDDRLGRRQRRARVASWRAAASPCSMRRSAARRPTPSAARLMVMVGGREKDVARARPLFEAMADTIHYMGPAGSGIRTKLVNNYMSMVDMLRVAEALTLGGEMRARPRQSRRGHPRHGGRQGANQRQLSEEGAGRRHHAGLSLAHGAEGHQPRARSGGGDRLAPGARFDGARDYFALARSWGRENQDCTAMLLLLEDIARARSADTPKDKA